jgi:hypothetical protein
MDDTIIEQKFETIYVDLPGPPRNSIKTNMTTKSSHRNLIFIYHTLSNIQNKILSLSDRIKIFFIIMKPTAFGYLLSKY